MSHTNAEHPVTTLNLSKTTSTPTANTQAPLNKSRPQFKYQSKPVSESQDYMEFDTLKDLHDLIGIEDGFGDLYLETQKAEVYTINDYRPNEDKYFYVKRGEDVKWILTPVGYKIETAKIAASTFIYLWLRGIPAAIAANLAVTNALIGRVNNHDLNQIAKKHLEYTRRSRVDNTNMLG